MGHVQPVMNEPCQFVQGMPQPTRLAEVHRMLAAETERLQDTARQLKMQHAHLPRMPMFADASGFEQTPARTMPIDLRSPSITPPTPIGSMRVQALPALGMRPVHDSLALAEDLGRSHREAQETMKRLQMELGLAEASLHQACSDGVHLQAIEARAAQREVEQYYECEMRQVRHEHRALEEALENACEQLRRKTQLELSAKECVERTHKVELDRLSAELRDAELRERQACSGLKELQLSVRRLQSERDSEKDALAKWEKERDGMTSKVRCLKSELGEMRATELEDRLERQRIEQNSRTMAEEKLRLHADRGRLREAHQQAERELQAEAQALREARRTLEHACSSEEEAEKRRRTAVAEASESTFRAQQLASASREDARLADFIRTELADFVAERALEQRNWQEAEQRTSSRIWQVEPRLQELLSRLDHMLAQGSRPLSPSRPQSLESPHAEAALRAALAEARTRAASLEAALEQERARGEVELQRRCGEIERQSRTELERRCLETTRELERLRAHVRQVEGAQEQSLKALRMTHSDLQSSAAQDQQALKEAEAECRRLRAEVAQERRGREAAEARLRTAFVAASATAPPKSLAMRPALRQRSGSSERRFVRIGGPEFISPMQASAPTSSEETLAGMVSPKIVAALGSAFLAARPLAGATAREAGMPRPPTTTQRLGPSAVAARSLSARGGSAAVERPRTPSPPRLGARTLALLGRPSRRLQSALQLELADLPRALRETLATATNEPLDAIASRSIDLDDDHERSLMVRLYVIMSEMLELPIEVTKGPEFLRLWRFLDSFVEMPTSPGSSEGTRTPPEVLEEEGRHRHLL